MSLLSVKNLSARFGAFTAFDGVDIELAKGSLTGLIGTNGAGKSTLFSAITGYITPSSGEVKFDGHDMLPLSIEKRVEKGLSRTFQVPREFSRLSVFQNLMAAPPNQAGESLAKLFITPGRVRRQEAELAERADSMLQFLNLARVADTPAGSLSGGQKKLLELGRLLMLEPSCIMLDEPFAGVNPVLVEELSQRIVELNQRGITLLIIEHDLASLSRLVPRLYAMDRGRIIAEGKPSEVLADPRVREAYMGGVI
ncbi:ABC transporter ATP-binding protein [Pseudaminobacter sp. 19-2017]|uniref:ABC transporter ATP-binding protein n=1 Tax=Pseudaminobacter soli (ex Zhang et al. 2022) TaxID=2831468 RepID=A0A942DXR3_9HYPH|nr:ABC transporter ATP-binding protein [Pseudaminobacter soli]MBS3649814.1 ABC transporter ATP-binding protein [Pseudaminobacter soli]